MSLNEHIEFLNEYKRKQAMVDAFNIGKMVGGIERYSIDLKESLLIYKSEFINFIRVYNEGRYYDIQTVYHQLERGEREVDECKQYIFKYIDEAIYGRDEEEGV